MGDELAEECSVEQDTVPAPPPFEPLEPLEWRYVVGPGAFPTVAAALAAAEADGHPLDGLTVVLAP